MPRSKLAARSIAILALSWSVIATPAGADAGTAFDSTLACDAYASPSGRDINPGTAIRPVRTVQKLADRLASGQTGCLKRGSYIGNLVIAKDRIKLTSAPGTRALLLGYVWIKDSADGVTLANLDIDGRGVGPITVQVQGDGALLHRLDISNRNKLNSTNTGSCLLLGVVGAPAFDTTVRESRIHNCGGGNGGHDHAIYSEFARRAVIRDNYLYDNPGFGISMYPDSQGNVIEHNVIDGNGYENRGNVTFSGEVAGAEYSSDYASSNNVLRYNLITNARRRYNIDSYFPSTRVLPVGNVVSSNCIWNAPWGPITSEGGFSYTNNLGLNPLYVGRARKDFRLQSGSPCAGWGPLTQPVSILDTFLTGHPGRSVTSHRATFRFGATVRAARFRCKIDARPYRGCSSPKRYLSLARGWHRFLVRAVNPATGRLDRTPAIWRWQIR
jgi:hypothetical protein